MLSTLQGSSGQITLTLVPPERAQDDRRSSSRPRSARSCQGIAGIRALGPGPVAAGLRLDAVVARRLHGARLGLGRRSSTSAEKIKDELETSGLVTDLNSDYQVGAPELQIVPDRRRATELGVSVTDLGDAR